MRRPHPRGSEPLLLTMWLVAGCAQTTPTPEAAETPAPIVAPPTAPSPAPVPATPSKDASGELTFSAEVGEVVQLADFSGTAIAVHPDPRYVVPLAITAAPEADPVLVEGTTVNFAIHSPSKLFIGPAPTGRAVEFSVQSREIDGTRRWSALRIR